MSRMFARFGYAFLAAAMALAGCAVPVEEDGKTVESVASRSVLRVGLTPNYPPVVDRIDGEFAGIEIDLANEAAKGLDKRFQFIELPFEQLIPALTSGEIDIIMSGMSITAEREQQIAFTEPYLHIGQMAITRVAEVQRLGSVTALLNAPITAGFEPGTTGETFVKTNMRNAKPMSVPSIDAAVEALRSRQIDVFIHDAPTAWRIGSDAAYQDLIGLYWPLTDEYLAWGVRKSDQELRAALSDQITKMTADGRLSRITRKWIKVRVEVR